MTGVHPKSLARPSGLTLIELVAALGMFTLVVGVLASIFLTTLRTVQANLTKQQAFDNMRYSLEYMARAIRQADPDFLVTTAPTGVPGNKDRCDVDTGCLQFDRPDGRTIGFELCTSGSVGGCIPDTISEVFQYCNTNPSILCNSGCGGGCSYHVGMCSGGTCTNSVSSQRVTPQSVCVDSLNFVVANGAPTDTNAQPRVTIAVSFHPAVNGDCSGSAGQVELQTTVALRRLKN